MDQDLRPSGSATILLVEDDEILFNFFRRLLSAKGYTLLAARDAEQALALDQRHEGPIHLLLSDVVMPGMRGDDLAMRLCARRPEMKVILMSGYTEPSVRDHGIPAPKAAFIQKPFNTPHLLSQVRKMIGASSA